jgi:hypothetical protein
MPIKGRSRALVREGWPRGGTGRRIRLSLSLSPSRTLVTPYCKCTRPGRRTTRRPRVSPFACLLFPPSCSVLRRPIWAGTRGDNLLVGPGTPRGRNANNITTNLGNKRNRHNYGSVIGVHDKSTQRAQQAQLWLDDHG